MEFADSAAKHDIDRRDIEHAVRNAVVIEDLDENMRLYLGPDQRAALLEIISLLRDTDDELVIHAMPMRAKYRRLLPGGDQ